MKVTYYQDNTIHQQKITESLEGFLLSHIPKQELAQFIEQLCDDGIVSTERIDALVDDDELYAQLEPK